MPRSTWGSTDADVDSRIKGRRDGACMPQTPPGSCNQCIQWVPTDKDRDLGKCKVHGWYSEPGEWCEVFRNAILG